MIPIAIGNRHGHRRRVLNVVALALAVVYAGYLSVLYWSARVKVAEIRDRGEPVIPSQLNQLYPETPPGENASVVFEKAFQQYATWDSNKLARLPIAGKADLPKRDEPLSEDTKGLIAEYLATNRDALVLLYQGATIRHARYAVDFACGLGLVRTSHLNNVRVGERLLCLEAVLRAEQTNSQEAVASIESGFGVANSLSTEPYLISQLVRGACDNMGFRALERVLNRVEIADTNLTELISVLSRAENPRAMKLSFLAERCLGIDAFEKITGWGFKDILNAVSGKSMEINPDYRVSGSFVLFWNATGFKDLDTIRYLDLMDAYIRVADKPVSERFRAIEPIRARIDALPRRYLLSRLLTGSLDLAFIRDLQSTARLRAARTAVAIKRYRLAQKGELPHSLDELAPKYLDAVPSDPFDDGQLRYKKLVKGYVVYSVGEDGKDDGGDEKKDITFTVER